MHPQYAVSIAVLKNNVNAKIAQLVERDLAKVEVAGSSPVFRSITYNARVVKLVDTLDLKSSEQQCSCGFKSRLEYKKLQTLFGAFFVIRNLCFLYIYYFQKSSKGIILEQQIMLIKDCLNITQGCM